MRVRFLTAVVGILTLGGGLAIAGAPAASAAPLFPQCPAVGADTGCGILITLNANGTTTVASDPSNGPYDGSEDTLIGVVNNSGKSLASLPLTSSGQIDPAFEFDGDGLCTFITCTWPNPTTYEGPITSFSNISADLNSGTVNFTGGLATGKSTYFSLEGVVTTASIVVAGHAPSIFEVDLRHCDTLHVGYHYFPAGTVINWRVKQDGTGTVGTGSTTTTAPSGKTFHFVNLATTLALKSGVHTHIYFNWTIKGVKTTFTSTRGPACTQ